MLRKRALRRGVHVAANAVVEAVEPRRLLSIALIDGQLQVKGTSGRDDIRVDSDDAPSRIRVQVNDTVRRFDTSDVSSLVLSGLEGDDRIEVATT
ncbi:MAG TPA: hypothetical protein PLD59_14735, partial [Tepidisphaeraceae bacterium]|nr:hypothetical protein [Tepidisphaeraceae bacterium]